MESATDLIKCICLEKDLLEDKPYQIIDQFNERKIRTVLKFYLVFLSKIHPFYNGNGRTSKILFGNDNEITKLISKTNLK